MSSSHEFLRKIAALFVLFLQFVTVPFLGDIDMGGKLFLFAFATLPCSIFFFRSVSIVRFSPVFGLFAILWTIFFASTAQASNPAWAVHQVGILAIYLLFLLMVTHSSANMSLFGQKLIDAILLTGVVAAALGLYEWVHSLLFGPTRSMLIPYLLPPNGGIRVGGIYGQPNLFAVFLTVVLLAFFYNYLHRLPVASSRLLTLRYLPFFLVSFVFFLTGSRGGILSFSLISGFMALLVARGRYLAGDTNARVEFCRLFFLLGVAFIAVKSISWWYTGMHIGSSLGNVGISTDARFLFWTSTVLIFLDHPWMGVGLDGFRFLQNAYGPSAHEVLGFVKYEAMGNTNWAHNEVLQILCEGGIFSFFIVLLLLCLFIYMLCSKFLCRGEFQPFFLYSHLFLLPFIIQSMFSWPFRHPGLLVLFFAFLGVLLSQYPMKDFEFSFGGRHAIIFFLLIALGVASHLFYTELEIGTLKREIKSADHLQSTFTKFETLAKNPYSSHRVLTDTLPIFTRFALSNKNNDFLKKILPYYERLCQTEGARTYWYNLALIYFKLGDERNSHKAIRKAIDLMPSDEDYWAFLHYLNILEASRKTGQPLNYYLPKGREVDFSELRGYL